MAEIIHKGRMPQDEWYATSCGHCHCYFKFQKKELEVSSNSYSIACPFCAKSVWLSSLEGKKYNPPTVDPY